jgi:protein-S-isoprenylcysteine O-methyltransferase Ste14
MTKGISQAILIFRSLFWIIVLPGTVTVYLPHLIVTRWSPTAFPGWGMWQLLALIPIGIGAAVLLHCIWGFAAVGRGTLSPVDPPKKLVVKGLYRYVRNPMYVGVVTILLGEALLLQSLALLEYALVGFAAFNLFVILYEEPTLRDQFGESYEHYCRHVGRWLPGKRYSEGV